MKRFPAMIVALALALFVAPVTLAQITHSSVTQISADLNAAASGTLSDGGFVNVSLNAPAIPGNSPATLNIVVNDFSAGVFAFFTETLSTSDFQFSDVNSASLHTTIGTNGGSLAGSTFNVMWTGFGPLQRVIQLNQVDTDTTVFHTSTQGMTRAATVSGSATITGIPPTVTCCSFGNTQISRNASQRIEIIHP